MCANFSTGLNAALKDYHYTLPSTEEIFAKVNGVNFFSKIDLGDTYLQIMVKEKCPKLPCINTHRRLYKFRPLPFGVKVATVIFQQVIDTMLSDLDFTVAYLDDILMKSQNVEQHKVLFTNPSARAGYDTRSIFKRSLTGLNSEFSFS